jgi:hypothetical protein
VGSLLWACWVVLVSPSCLFRCAFRFFNKIFLTYQKKKKVWIVGLDLGNLDYIF